MQLPTKKLDDHYAIVPLVHGYHIQAKFPNFVIRSLDNCLSVVLPVWNYIRALFSRRSTAVVPPKKILLANIAHNGDVIITLSLVKAIKDSYPDSEIGFLAGSWCKVILDNHPWLHHVHYFDHWRISRAKTTLIKRIITKIKTSREVVRQLKSIGYDAAIDVYHLFPNAIPLIWRAKIPVRFGFVSGGFGPMLTNPHTWRLRDKHIAYNYLDLARELLPEIPANIFLQSVLARNSVIDIGKFGALIKKQYIICHPSSGNILRNWPIEKWRTLKEKLLAQGYQLVFTGLGEQENLLIEQIIQESVGCINLCNKIQWDELVEVIANAACIFSSDTAASHVAAAVDTPSVVLIGGLVNYHNWQPLTAKTTVVYKKLPCIPCYRSFGCVDLECIRGTTVEQVLAAIQNFMSIKC